MKKIHTQKSDTKKKNKHTPNHRRKIKKIKQTINTEEKYNGFKINW